MFCSIGGKKTATSDFVGRSTTNCATALAVTSQKAMVLRRVPKPGFRFREVNAGLQLAARPSTARGARLCYNPLDAGKIKGSAISILVARLAETVLTVSSRMARS